jgi:hypothetical protein
VPRYVRSLLVGAGVALASALIAYRFGSLGDYPQKSVGRTISSVLDGHVVVLLDAQVDGGPFSMLIRLPFALGASLLRGDEVDIYRWGSVPCIAAGALLGVLLAWSMKAVGQPAFARVATVAVCAINPLTVDALSVGHPEEILTAALAAGAMLVLLRGYVGWSAALFGLAVVSKQWAFLAAAPLLLAVLLRHVSLVRYALVAGVVIVAFSLPYAVRSPDGFVEAQVETGVGGYDVVDRYTVWRLFAHRERVPIDPVAGRSEVEVLRAPGWTESLVRPLVALLSWLLVIPLLLRRKLLAPTDAALFMAMVFLLRCTLDPVDNQYYHLPLLFALLTWECLSIRGIPILSLIVAFVWELSPGFGGLLGGDPHAAFYLSWTTPLLIWMAVRLYAPGAASRLRDLVTSAGVAMRPKLVSSAS